MGGLVAVIAGNILGVSKLKKIDIKRALLIRFSIGSIVSRFPSRSDREALSGPLSLSRVHGGSGQPSRSLSSVAHSLHMTGQLLVSALLSQYSSS